MHLFLTLFMMGLSLFAGVSVFENTALLIEFFPFPDFLAIPLEDQADLLIVRIIFGILAGSLLFFILAYLLQALLDAFRLMWIHRFLEKAVHERRFKSSEITPYSKQVVRVWRLYPLFTRLWRDFTATLHAQKSADGKFFHYRTTTPPKLYFNTRTLVDTPMRVAFFRHLPGILTGTGIIGTFAGILLGLTEFNPTVEADQVTEQLHNLFAGVSTAFIASFFAISCAIAVTVVEKLTIYGRYAQVERLLSTLDILFKGGAGEEYLASLVKTETQVLDRLETASQHLAKQLQQSLREALREVGAQRVTSEERIMKQMESWVKRLETQMNLSADQLGHSISKQFSQYLDQRLSEQLGLINELSETSSQLIQQQEQQETLRQEELHTLQEEVFRHIENQFTSITSRQTAMEHLLSKSAALLAEQGKKQEQQGILVSTSQQGISESISEISEKISGVEQQLANNFANHKNFFAKKLASLSQQSISEQSISEISGKISSVEQQLVDSFADHKNFFTKKLASFQEPVSQVKEQMDVQRKFNEWTKTASETHRVAHLEHHAISKKIETEIARLDDQQSTLQEKFSSVVVHLKSLEKGLTQRHEETMKQWMTQLQQMIVDTEQEQTAFIEMLSERIDMLRKKMKIS